MDITQSKDVKLIFLDEYLACDIQSEYGGFLTDHYGQVMVKRGILFHFDFGVWDESQSFEVAEQFGICGFNASDDSILSWSQR